MVDRLDATLSKGLMILETLAASGSPLGVTEIGARLGMNKSSVHRLVQTLCRMGYIVQEADRSYRTGLKLWRLGCQVMDRHRVVGLCRGAMDGLLRNSGESVHLSMLEGLHTLYVDKLDSDQPVRAYTERGGTAPLHCVATGKVLLAHDYAALRAALLASGLERHTPATIVDPTALDREMAAIRAQGYAINRGEYRGDVGGVAAPILAPDGKLLAAIGISGPLSRLTEERVRELVPAVIDAARSVCDLLRQGG